MVEQRKFVSAIEFFCYLHLQFFKSEAFQAGHSMNTSTAESRTLAALLKGHQ